MITELGASLSGGQKKKMLLAKFLAAHKNRTVLILDEPESNLDSETLKVWEDIRAQLVNEREKHIVFYISHEVGANGFENKRIKI